MYLANSIEELNAKLNLSLGTSVEFNVKKEELDKFISNPHLYAVHTSNSLEKDKPSPKSRAPVEFGLDFNRIS
jgi:hypothetical protein